jgi:ABC-2 type transport system ATP-binding protein
LSRRDLEERFDEIIAFAELERFVDQRLKNYSSGMQVRLAYSVAIQVPFDILLVDEVLAVGDAKFQQKCARTFDEFQAAGKTLLLVSHSPTAIRDYCDRAILLEDGAVVSIGPAAEVVDLYYEREGIATS